MDIVLVKAGTEEKWTFHYAENGYVRVNYVAEYTRTEADATIAQRLAQGWVRA